MLHGWRCLDSFSLGPVESPNFPAKTLLYKTTGVVNWLSAAGQPIGPKLGSLTQQTPQPAGTRLHTLVMWHLANRLAISSHTAASWLAGALVELRLFSKSVLATSTKTGETRQRRRHKRDQLVSTPPTRPHAAPSMSLGPCSRMELAAIRDRNPVSRCACRR